MRFMALYITFTHLGAQYYELNCIKKQSGYNYFMKFTERPKSYDIKPLEVCVSTCDATKDNILDSDECVFRVHREAFW